jgi:hypothetical protein
VRVEPSRGGPTVPFAAPGRSCRRRCADLRVGQPAIAEQRDERAAAIPWREVPRLRNSSGDCRSRQPSEPDRALVVETRRAPTRAPLSWKPCGLESAEIARLPSAAAATVAEANEVPQVAAVRLGASSGVAGTARSALPHHRHR